MRIGRVGEYGSGPRRAWPLVIVSLWWVACSAGVHYRVKPGENLYRIGKAYGMSYRQLARANRIPPPYKIKPGQYIYVPGRSRQLPVDLITPRSVNPARPGNVTTKGSPVAGGFEWPIRGKIVAIFGPRSNGHHDGIDIAAAKGSPVHAARDGVVIYSDRLAGYGKVVILEHSRGYTTVYAHNDQNLVRKGDHVRRGDRIATVGSTGRASGPHLHFEIRKNNVARNPRYYLPSRRAGRG